MHEPSAYLSINDNTEATSAASFPARTIISKALLKQLVFSAVVIVFVSIGAVSISSTYSSSPAVVGDPSNSTVRTVLHIPLVTQPPTPVPSAPAPTPQSSAGTANGVPLVTPTRSTPRPSSTTPPVGSTTGNSSQSNPSGVVDFSGKDNNDESSSGSKSSPPSSASPSSTPGGTAGSTPSPGSAGFTATPTPDPRAPGSRGDDPAAPFPTAPASLASSTSAPSAGSTTTATGAPTPSSNSGTPADPPTVYPSLPGPTPQSAAPLATPKVTQPQADPPSAPTPRPTPQRTTTSTPPMPTVVLNSAPEPTTPPRSSYLPSAAIQDAAEPTVDIVGVANLPEYPDMGCSLPSYISKNGKVLAIGPAGETQQLIVKGVNWFGMESDARVPLGLWSNDHEGSTLFEIGAFLARNNFNSVRLPISVASVLSNAAPDKTRVAQVENLALNLDSYMSTLQSIVKGLAFHHISVLISLDARVSVASATTQQTTDGEISEEAQLEAIDVLASSLCSKAYWNVLGLDLKSNPVTSTWGDDSHADLRVAATRMGNRMLEGCSKWLAFVEGNSESHEWTSPSTKKTYSFEDWWGGGLSKAKAFPVTLSIPDKVVYAPHYHSPSAYPSSYFYQDDGVSELADRELEANVHGTMDFMFGYLAKEPDGPALVLGEFGGLYTTDRHPQRTTRRAFEYTVKMLAETSGFAGGYVWSLNPESDFDFNYGRAAADSAGGFREGLVRSDWRSANLPLLEALRPLDATPGLRPLQCIKKTFRLRRR